MRDSLRQKMRRSRWQLIRLLLVWGVLCTAALGLGIRIYRLQIINALELKQKARLQQGTAIAAYIPRRSIVDRQGNMLATDRIVYSLYAHPKLFSRPADEIAAQLSEILTSQSPQALSDRFQRQASGIRLADTLTEDQAQKIAQLSLDGLELVRGYSRFYPHAELGASVVGYVRIGEHSGQAGIELTQQQLLARIGEPVQATKTGKGEIVPRSLPDDALHFDALRLQLTLDLRLQRAAREALQKQMADFNAKRGTVIVMDALDGSLLALVSEPSYDPNHYYRFDLERFKTWAVSDLYEPGSTFKPINVAIALEAGAIAPNAIIHDSGKARVGGWTIRNHDYKANGQVSIAEILQVSSNVGMIEIMQRLPPKAFYQALKDLGIDQKVGIDLMGETPGHLKSEFHFLNYPIEPATAAFGQGLALTPIKLVQLHGAIANGGKLVTPHVIRGLVDPQGNLHQTQTYPSKPVFSPQTSQTVLKMMETVVNEGSGEPAQIPGYRIAGKTGTAQKAANGYYGSGKITSFVGIMPVEAPRYVVLAVVDEPKRAMAFGSTVAAPIVKSVMEALIAIEGIPPSLEIKPKAAEKTDS